MTGIIGKAMRGAATAGYQLSLVQRKAQILANREQTLESIRQEAANKRHGEEQARLKEEADRKAAQKDEELGLKENEFDRLNESQDIIDEGNQIKVDRGRRVNSLLEQLVQTNDPTQRANILNEIDILQGRGTLDREQFDWDKEGEGITNDFNRAKLEAFQHLNTLTRQYPKITDPAEKLRAAEEIMVMQGNILNRYEYKPIKDEFNVTTGFVGLDKLNPTGQSVDVSAYEIREMHHRGEITSEEAKRRLRALGLE